MASLTVSQAATRRYFIESTGNMMVIGRPGCGKSFLLKEMQSICNSRNQKHHTLAMRGHNAHDVGGSTIHSRLVPLPHNKSICKTSAELRECLWKAMGGSLGGTPDFWKVVAREEFWKSLDVLFIDEVFLVDAGMFALTDLYARRIRGVDESFGGIRLCVMGDALQMCPRGDGALHVFRPVPIGSPPDADDWSSDSDDDGEKVIGEKYLADGPAPVTIENTELRPWEDAALTPFILTENKRQQGADQSTFCDILIDVSIGKAIRDMIPERLELLKSMCKTEIPDDTYALFWSREDVARRNEECNNRVTGPVLAELAIEFYGVGPPTAQLIGLRDAFVAELPLEGKVIVVKEGSPLMLLSNLDLSKGAYRGAVGTVADVIRDDEEDPGKITGVMLNIGDEPFLVKPRLETFVDGDSTCTVSFWPLGYGFAGTFDSAQGKTIAKLAIGVTPRMPAGMLNVGLSRVRRYQDLAIFANVNRYNSETDAWKILQIPSLTRVDKHAEEFMQAIRKKMGHAVLDHDVLENMKQTTKRKRVEDITVPGCTVCGEAPQVVFSCGHAVSCMPCWEAAKRDGVATCFKCSVPVTRTMRVCF